jgi:hypothetical protein
VPQRPTAKAGARRVGWRRSSQSTSAQ